MRLTYRTMRVLLAVAAHPGGSNRQVADGPGISDQGQISKLLARLHGLGLIENTGAGSVRGRAQLVDAHREAGTYRQRIARDVPGRQPEAERLAAECQPSGSLALTL